MFVSEFTSISSVMLAKTEESSFIPFGSIFDPLVFISRERELDTLKFIYLQLQIRCHFEQILVIVLLMSRVVDYVQAFIRYPW